jgi:CheY-like chemotaxis protein
MAVNDVSQWNVLIVDDEPDNVGVVEYVFRFYNARVRTAPSGHRCLELLREELPTVLLLDIQMPSLSGEEVLKMIRENPAWKHLKVIALTAHAMEGDRERFLAAGFDGYIPKPISPMTLIKDVQRVVEPVLI